MAELFRLAVTAIDRPEPVPAENTAPPQQVVIDNCIAAIREAAERGADLVLLPEEPDIIAGGTYGVYPLEKHPVFTAFRDQAAACGIGVVSTLSVRVGDRHANTAFLLDRKGAVLGLYRKKHPAPTEEAILTDPVRPGDPFPVFDFEGIRIGIAICMDIHFPEMFRIYGLKGADLVLARSTAVTTLPSPATSRSPF
ncbi:MAG: carbon-nitrogen hydrolase family protein [Candidatus Hydrogenedentes bacterium]|nr:carbon-nitrogen hydrolase family protein [Candidatus Hydrogenedentota bacterium]